MGRNVERTHDKQVYLSEDRYNKPKEYFLKVAQALSEPGVLDKTKTLYDFGCATGEFLYFIRGLFPQVKLIGYDLIPELIDKAKQRVEGPEFRVGSVLDRDLLPAASVDVATMLGLHDQFDDFEIWLGNLIRWTRPSGRIYVFGLFNEHPVDVWVKHRLSDDPNPDHREPGWNLISKVSISRYLARALGRGRHSFSQFELSFDLAPNPTDPARAWTFLDDKKRRFFTNGLSLIYDLELLEIRP